MSLGGHGSLSPLHLSNTLVGLLLVGLLPAGLLILYFASENLKFFLLFLEGSLPNLANLTLSAGLRGGGTQIFKFFLHIANLTLKNLT